VKSEKLIVIGFVCVLAGLEILCGLLDIPLSAHVGCAVVIAFGLFVAVPLWLIARIDIPRKR
jgi:hypothetical protein